MKRQVAKIQISILKKIFIILICTFAAIQESVFAQSQTIEIEDFDKVIIQNRYETNEQIKAFNLYTLQDNWEIIRKQLDFSMGPNCNKKSSNITYCSFSNDGLEIIYSDYLDQFEFLRLTLTKSTFIYKVDKTEIAVGDNISKISTLYAEAYQNRHKLKSDDGNIYQVLLLLKYTDVSIAFEYNKSTQRITKIEIHQSLL